MLDEAAWTGGTYLRDLLSHLCHEKKVQRTKGGQRKLRLFGCACCRQIWDRIPPGPCRHAVEIADQYAWGLATRQDLKSARDLAVPYLSSSPITVRR